MKVIKKVKTSSYKINKFWGYSVQHGDYSICESCKQ